MSEMDDFFAVESSAPSVTGLSDSWDIDDFSIEEPDSGQAPSRNLATVHEIAEHATSPPSKKTAGPEGSSGSYELVSSPSAGGDNSQEPKPEADQETNPSCAGAAVDGWDDDPDFFPDIPADESPAVLAKVVPPVDQHFVDSQPSLENSGKPGPAEASNLFQDPPSDAAFQESPLVVGGVNAVDDDVSFFDNFADSIDGVSPQQSGNLQVNDSSLSSNPGGVQQPGLATDLAHHGFVSNAAISASDRSMDGSAAPRDPHGGDGNLNQRVHQLGGSFMTELRGALENDVRELGLDGPMDVITANTQGVNGQHAGESFTESLIPPAQGSGGPMRSHLPSTHLGNLPSVEHTILGADLGHASGQGSSWNVRADLVGEATCDSGDLGAGAGELVDHQNRADEGEQLADAGAQRIQPGYSAPSGCIVGQQSEEAVTEDPHNPANVAESPTPGANSEQNVAGWNQSITGAGASELDQMAIENAASGVDCGHGGNQNGGVPHANETWNQHMRPTSTGMQGQLATGGQAALEDDVAFFDQLDNSGTFQAPVETEASSGVQPDTVPSAALAQPEPIIDGGYTHHPSASQTHLANQEETASNSYQYRGYVDSGDQYHYNYHQPSVYPQADAGGNQYHQSFTQPEAQPNTSNQGHLMGYNGSTYQQPQQPSWSPSPGYHYQPPQPQQTPYLANEGTINEMNPPSNAPPVNHTQQALHYGGYGCQEAAGQPSQPTFLANPLEEVDDMSFFDNLGGPDPEPVMNGDVGASTGGDQQVDNETELAMQPTTPISPESVAKHEGEQLVQPADRDTTAGLYSSNHAPQTDANQVPQTGMYDSSQTGYATGYAGANAHASMVGAQEFLDPTTPFVDGQASLDQGVASGIDGSYPTWNQNDQAAGQSYQEVSLFQPQQYNPSPGYGTSQQQWGAAGEGGVALPGDNSMRLAPSVPVASENSIHDPYAQAGEKSNWPRHLHGRPACPLISFGIGGKVALMIPKVNLSETSCGQIEIHSLRNLPTILSHRQREAGFDIPAGGVDPVRAAIERFPGPLGATTNRDKLAAFITERMELCTEEENCDDPDGLTALWRTLRAMVKHPGFLVDRKAKSDPVANQEFVDTLSADGAVKKSWMGNGGSAVLSHQETENQFQRQTAAVETQKLVTVGNLEGALEAAKAGGLWDVALVLSQSLGHKAFCETASLMATQKLTLGSPLRMLFQLLSGHHENAMEEQDGSGVSKSTIMGVSAGYSVMTPESDPVLDDWRGNLAMLATNKTAFSKDVAVKLGDKLMSKRNNLLAAHLCYLVGGVLPQPMDSAGAPCRLALLGWDHKGCCQPHAEVIQRTEIFEWAYTVSNPSNRIVALQPYKLLYAWTLAEYGKISEAAHYCELVLEALKSLGNKVPPGLMVCAASARELLERIQQHALVHNISLKRSSTLLESFGRILDKGINRLIGMGDQPLGGEEGLSRRSSQSEGRTPSDVISSYKRTTSQTSFESMRNMSEENRQRLSPQPPMLSTSPAPHTPKHYYDALPPPVAKYPPPTPRTPPTPTAPSTGGPAKQPPSNPRAAAFQPPSGGPLTSPKGQSQRASNDGGGAKAGHGGWFSKLWGVGGGKPKDTEGGRSNVKVANLGQSNQFYYDKTLGRWVMPGEEDKVQGPTSAPPPPPTLEWGNTPPQSPLGASSRTASQGSLGGRYIDTFGGGNHAQPAAPLQFPGVPPPRGAAGTKPPTFFVPSTARTPKTSDTEFEDVTL